MAAEESAVGYVIREEIVLNQEGGNDYIDKIKTEGEKVSKGETIAQYYTIKKDDVENKINEIDNKIQEALEAEKDIYSSDIKALDTQIESKLLSMVKKNNIQEIGENRTDVNSYIIKKAKISGELSPAGSNIKELIKEKTDLEKKLLEGSKAITAPSSGVVSYRIDNLEDSFKFDNIENITDETLNSLDTKTGKIVSTSNDKAKVVDNFKCYILVESDSEEANNAKIGDKLTVKFSTGEEVKATVEYIKEHKKAKVLVLGIIQNVEKLINYRKISVELIWWSVERIKSSKYCNII